MTHINLIKSGGKPSSRLADPLSHLDGLINDRLKTKLFSAAQIAVLCRGQSYSKHWGECTGGSLFDIASITKYIVNYLLLKTCHEQGISLDTPVHTILPEFSGEDDRGKVTIKHLLTFTAYFQTKLSFKDVLEHRTNPAYRDMIWHELMHAPVAYEPGREFRYTNAASILASRLVDHLNRSSKVASHVCHFVTHLNSPMELDLNRGITHQPVADRCVSSGYCEVRGSLRGIVADETSYILNQVGAAGIFANASSMVEVLRMIDEGYVKMGYPRAENALEPGTKGVSLGYGLGHDLIFREAFGNGTRVINPCRYFSAYTGPCVVSSREHDLHVAIFFNIHSRNGRRDQVQHRLVTPTRKVLLQAVFRKFLGEKE